jgi:hypothetical protein
MTENRSKKSNTVIGGDKEKNKETDRNQSESQADVFGSAASVKVDNGKGERYSIVHGGMNE